ncbi:MAG: tRNA (adenosine(37)-N6)-dimethylallyltransferase MiaA [Eggerthellales bacterium]|nr:tRNA (adenosine(37)-N6)-dimethylallyltransferase MiaA [Eggerthellales bacterium]
MDQKIDSHTDALTKARVICVVGPTASGKTDLSQELALALNGEVVSADSMQIYKGMDIGTGKLPVEDRKVPHWGFDLVEPGDDYSVALYQSYARDAFRNIQERGKTPILCGGTGLYVRAAIDDYDFPAGEQTENPVRERYTAYAQEHGNQALWDLLNQVDPDSAAVIHPNNVRRVVRAFELREEGASYAVQKENLQHIPQAVPAVIFGISFDREPLVQRIYQRVDKMIELGLVDEVKILLEKGFRTGITAPQAIGYKEIVEALDGRCTMDEAIEQIKIATRRYAKRQRSWFRRDDRIIWLNGTNATSQQLCAQAIEYLRNEQEL